MTKSSGNGSIENAPEVVQTPLPMADGEESAPTSFPTVTKDAIRQAFEQGKYPYDTKMSKREYESKKAKLQAELLKVQIMGAGNRREIRAPF